MEVEKLEQALQSKMADLGFSGFFNLESIKQDYYAKFCASICITGRSIAFDCYGRSAYGINDTTAAARLWLKAAQSLQPETVLN